MNVFIWILQILLAAVYLSAGVMKVSQPKEKLLKNMGWVEDFSANTVKVIGIFEILGALGLILPAWTGIAPILTPIAAVGIVALMIGAMLTHIRRREPQGIATTAVLLVLAAIVAWGRFGPYGY